MLANLLAPGFIVIPAANDQAPNPTGLDGRPTVASTVPVNSLQQSVAAAGDGSRPVPPASAMSEFPVPSASVETEALPPEAAVPPRSGVPFREPDPRAGRTIRKATSEGISIPSDLHRTGSPALDRQTEPDLACGGGVQHDVRGGAPDGGLLVQPTGAVPADGGSVELAPRAGAIPVEPTAATSPASVERSAEPRSMALVPADHHGRPVTARLLAMEAGAGQRLSIQLDPADLGRVEVALRLDHAGTAAAVFTVDRLETLLLLQRDARAVMDVLSSAGFTVDPGSVGFTLRDGNGEHATPHQPPSNSATPRGRQDEHGTVEAASSIWTRHGLLDLHV